MTSSEPLPSLACHVFLSMNTYLFSNEVSAARGLPECGHCEPQSVWPGAQTCGVDCGGLAPHAGAPDVEGSHVDRVALPGLQLHQGLAGRDAHNRPGQEAEPQSQGHAPGLPFKPGGHLCFPDSLYHGHDILCTLNSNCFCLLPLSLSPFHSSK